jgi:hypothetical protein
MNQQLPPPIALFRMITGYYVSRAIHVVAKLGIADLLSQGPRGVTGSQPPRRRTPLRCDV